jgi:hypothetical protein
MGLFERVTCNSREIQCKHSILQQRLHLWLAAKHQLPKVHTGKLHSTHVKPIKTDSEALERGNIENAFPAATHDPFDQFHRKNPAHKPPIQIQSSRLETITARRIDLRRAVSRLIGASYAIHELLNSVSSNRQHYSGCDEGQLFEPDDGLKVTEFKSSHYSRSSVLWLDPRF